MHVKRTLQIIKGKIVMWALVTVIMNRPRSRFKMKRK
jgi:hypothetical protein